ncbi:hypothetical protein Tco_1111924, partial [Tanacetum coccineum]
EELAIPEQTATGKGISNPLMAGSLPKTTKPTCFLVRGGCVTSVSLLPGHASAGLGLVPAHHILAASLCLIRPGAYCDNMVQAQRPGKPIIRYHEVGLSKTNRKPN